MRAHDWLIAEHRRKYNHDPKNCLTCGGDIAPSPTTADMEAYAESERQRVAELEKELKSWQEMSCAECLKPFDEDDVLLCHECSQGVIEQEVEDENRDLYRARKELEERAERLAKALRELLNELSDWSLEMMRGSIGNTNMACLRQKRDAALEAVNEVSKR